VRDRSGILHLVVVVLLFRPETHFARGSGEGWSGEEQRVLNRFVGCMAIVRVRSRRKEHGRTNGSSVLYTHQAQCEVNPMLVHGDHNACIGTRALLACGAIKAFQF
jgi:hypothetical protein